MIWFNMKEVDANLMNHADLKFLQGRKHACSQPHGLTQMTIYMHHVDKTGSRIHNTTFVSLAQPRFAFGSAI